MLQKLAVPIAIVVAGAMIAGAIFFVNSKPQAAAAPTNPAQGTVAKEVRGVQKDDHIRGNPNADIVIVEYSDTECPFCQRFHTTMKQVVEEFGKDGSVAWVYRHFPLDQLHPKARKEAEALECAAELGGNDAFWKFADALYASKGTPQGVDAAKLGALAASSAGVDAAKVQACVASGKYAEKVQQHVDEVVASGGRGTPHSIVIVDGEQVPIEGAQPYEVIKGLVQALLEQQ